MDREQLFQNLNELEKQLKGIKSATDQVNSVVAANRETIAAVTAYTAQAQQVLSSVRSIYDGDVAQIKQAAVEALDKSAENFEKKVNSIASDLITNTEGLKSMVEDTLKPLVKDDLVGLIDTDLKPFVKEEMPSTFRSFIDEYNTHFGTTLDSLKEATEKFSREASSAIEGIGNVKEIVEGSQTVILGSVTSMKENVDAMKSQLERTAETVEGLSRDFGSETMAIRSAVEEAGRLAVENITRAKDILGEKIMSSADQVSSDLSAKIDSASASVNNLLAGISSDMDSIKRSIRGVKDVGNDVKSVLAKVGSLESEVAVLHKENKTLKILAIVSILIQLVIMLGVFYKIIVKFL